MAIENVNDSESDFEFGSEDEEWNKANLEMYKNPDKPSGKRKHGKAFKESKASQGKKKKKVSE